MSYSQPASVSPLPEGITDPNYKPLPGRLGNLTPAQQHALDTLKRQLVDEGHFVPDRMDDATLLRYVLGPCTPYPSPRSIPMDTCLQSRLKLDRSLSADSSAHASLMWPRRKRCYCLPNSGGKTLGSTRLSSKCPARPHHDPIFNPTQPRNFEFTEKEEVDKYYPQYYHKMDKVRGHHLIRLSCGSIHAPLFRTVDRSTSNVSASLTSTHSTPSRPKTANSVASSSSTKNSSPSVSQLVPMPSVIPSKRLVPSWISQA